MPLYDDWSLEDRRKALTFLPLFEDPEFKPCEWVRLEGTLGWPEYDPRVYEFLEFAWNTPGIDPYDGEPWEQFWAKCWTDPAAVGSGSVGDVRRFLLLVKRRERFGDGTIESAFNKGLILTALRRLKELTPG